MTFVMLVLTCDHHGSNADPSTRCPEEIAIRVPVNIAQRTGQYSYTSRLAPVVGAAESLAEASGWSLNSSPQLQESPISLCPKHR